MYCKYKLFVIESILYNFVSNTTVLYIKSNIKLYRIQQLYINHRAFLELSISKSNSSVNYVKRDRGFSRVMLQACTWFRLFL